MFRQKHGMIDFDQFQQPLIVRQPTKTISSSTVTNPVDTGKP